MANIVRLVSDPTIVDCGNVTLRPGLRPSRVVLRHIKEEKKHVTHLEFFDVRVEKRGDFDELVLRHDGFGDGHYFDYESDEEMERMSKLSKADFEERLKYGR